MKEKTDNNWSRGKLEAVEFCPACDTKNIHAILKRHDNERSMPDIWSMAQCAACKSIWLNPRPDAKSLPRAYDDYYTHNTETEDIAKNSGTSMVWRLISGYLNQRFGMHYQPASKLGYVIFSLIEPWRLKLDYYGRHLTTNRVGKPGRLLDIGCGNGSFLARAVDMGWQAQGCEVDPKAIQACRSIGLDVIIGDAFSSQLIEQSFDVITMSHVIEHVHDQPALIQRAYDLLKPGGWLWLACPNPESIGIKVSGSAWHALHPPYHLCIPSKNALSNWLEESGFYNAHYLRRGSHVKNIWRISQTIAVNESTPTLSSSRFLIWRLIADTLATVHTKWAEETVLLAQKPE